VNEKAREEEIKASLEALRQSVAELTRVVTGGRDSTAVVAPRLESGKGRGGKEKE
jgi:cytidylate kinase